MCAHEDAPCCHGAHPPRVASRAPRGQNRREVTKRALQPTALDARMPNWCGRDAHSVAAREHEEAPRTRAQ